MSKVEVDHIFIFSDHPEKAADELLAFGLAEGSNRVHPGQGTRNRKFYFENFYLEILWVSNESEIRSDLTAPVKLWERAQHTLSGYSPFGLCLGNQDETAELFESCLKYQPGYLPPGMAIDVVTHENNPSLPWIFRWPFSVPKAKTEEPTEHEVGIKELTKVRFGVAERDFQSRFTELLSDKANIEFEYAEPACITLEFDHHKKGCFKSFSTMPLTIQY